MGWMVSPTPNSQIEVFTPRKWPYLEIESYRGDHVKMRSLIQHDWCLYKDGKYEPRRLCRENATWTWREAKEWGPEQISPSQLSERTNTDYPLIPDSQPPDWEADFCCLGPQSVAVCDGGPSKLTLTPRGFPGWKPRRHSSLTWECARVHVSFSR